MKILHISKGYAPIEGGIEEVCRLVVESLDNHENRVISFNNSNTTVDDIVDRIKVKRIGVFGKLASQPLSISYFYHLKRLIDDFKPDIINLHVPNPLCSFYLLLLIPRKTKLVIHYHAEILTSKFLYSIFKPIERKLFSRADLILATSPNLRDEAEPLSKYKSKCAILSNAVDTESLLLTTDDKKRVDEIRRQYPGKKIILSVGRHVPYKGLKYLLEGEQYIDNNAEIIIGGTGPITEELKQLTTSDRVHFIGRIPEDMMKIYYHAADIFAFPSITRAEAFGLTLCECMYCYTPPVTFKIAASGVNYVSLKNLTGVEVPTIDSKLFAEGINRLLRNDDTRKQYAISGHNRVSELFSVDVFRKAVKEIYESKLRKAILN